MQTYGWGAGILNSEELTDVSTLYVGTEGQSKRMEALKISCRLPEGVTLKYRAHVQTYGWLDWVDAGDSTKYAGTEGQSKRMEGIQISVSGLTDYKILYRAHVQTYGWLDWVDAEDPNAYAGTDHESKRMEALEIAIVADSEYTYKDNGNGQHKVEYKGKLIGIEDCSYGDWTVDTESSAKTITLAQECALCGHKATEASKTLATVFEEAAENGDGVVTLKSLNVNKAITVPEENTLVVDSLTGTSKITNKGTIIARKIDDEVNIVNSGETASVTVKGKYVKGEGNVLNDAMKVKAVSNIEVEEGSVAQTITAVETIKKGRKLTIELNGTTVKSTLESDYMIDNKGDLTIVDGKLVNTGKGGIKTTGNLEIIGGSIQGQERGICVGDTIGASLKNAVVTIKDATITVNDKNSDDEGHAIMIYGNNGNVTLENVNVTAKNTCVCTNGKSKNSSFTVTGGKLTSLAGTAVYLPASGNSTFTDTEIVGKQGLEAFAGSLTLKGVTVTANGEAEPNTLTTGEETKGGHAILLRVDEDYNADTKAKTLTLDVIDSVITSKNSFAVHVMQHGTNNCIVKTVNISYDRGSVVKGKTVAQSVDGNVTAKVVTTGIED